LRIPNFGKLGGVMKGNLERLQWAFGSLWYGDCKPRVTCGAKAKEVIDRLEQEKPNSCFAGEVPEVLENMGEMDVAVISTVPGYSCSIVQNLDLE
jgi:hypothetical protein